MKAIERLLRDQIGLDAASVGSSTIDRNVRLRMKSLGVNQAGEYQRLLERSSAAADPRGREEWDEFVESVLIKETWFFRDRESFKALVQILQDKSRDLRASPHSTGQTSPKHQISGLSVGCAAGEEPYSLAMALLDAGISPDRFKIDAVDLSARALARARRAVYGKNSFRGQVLDFRERFFEPTKDGYALCPRVRDYVQFHRANILADDFLARLGVVPADIHTGATACADLIEDGPYDFIFCRNLLIYFDPPTQAKALDKLAHLLAHQGVLFVGPAELPLATARGFVSANLPMAFACHKAGATKIPSPARPDRGQQTTVLQSTPPSPAALSSQTQAQVSALPDLTAARQLADAGKLDEAATIVQSHLDLHGPSAEAYCLLGLVRDAGGDPQAVDYYRRAIYLEPNHYETLLHMSLLLERSGDISGARTFKRRAERARPKH